MSTLPSRELNTLFLQFETQGVQARDSLCLSVKRSMFYVTFHEHDQALLTDRVAP